MSGMKMDGTTKVNTTVFPDTLHVPSDKQKILASLPTIHPQKKTMQQKISADGTIAYDTRQERNIASRYSGRIEKLYVKYMYQPVTKGELLMEVYSPEMVTEQRNLIFLLNDSLPDRQLISASKRKLMLLGMNEKDVDEVVKTRRALYSLPVYSPYEGHIHEATVVPGAANEFAMNASNMSELALKEGMYVEKGQTLFNILDPHMVWVSLKIYADDAGKIKLHQPVELMVEGTEKKWSGQVDFIEPFFQPESKTLSARVYLGNEYHTLRVGMYVRAMIEADSVSGIWIPKKAALDLGNRKIVWLKKVRKDPYGENVFEAHQIKTGITGDDFIQVTEGLNEEDEIASDAQYIQDSESFIR